MKYRYAITVICYNPDSNVPARIQMYSKIFSQVLVLDNSDTNKYLHNMQFADNVLYYDMHGNQGMSQALNIAYKWGMEQKFDYLLTMDQDSNYSKDNIDNMISYIEDNASSDVAIYVANFAKLYKDLKTDHLVPGKPVMEKHSVREVSMCLTSGSFVNLKAIKKILPLEDYFIAVVDNFISTELINKGYRLLRVGNSYFEQEVGIPVGNTWFNRTFKIVHHTPVRYYYIFRNGDYYREKYRKNKKLLIRSHIGRLRLIFNILVAEENKIQKLKACLQGDRDYKKRVLGKVSQESMIW